MRKALNYCDCMDMIGPSMESPEEFEALYGGSYFCDRYFLAIEDRQWQSFFDLACSCRIEPVTVLPIPGPKNEVALKNKAFELMERYPVREIVVNDYAMFIWLSREMPGLRVWLGRLLSKDIRDPRYTMRPEQSKLYDRALRNELSGMQPYGTELDLTEMPIRLTVSENVKLALHFPLAYLSTGRLCEFSGIGKPIEQKFRADTLCEGQCRNNAVRYERHGFSFVKFGRCVYTDNSRLLPALSGIDCRLVETKLTQRFIK